MSTNKVILEIDEYLMLLGENVHLKVLLAECVDHLCDHINPLYQEEVRYKYKIPMSTPQTDCMVSLVKNNILNNVLSKLCQITPDPAGKVDFEEVLAQFKGSLDVVTVTEEQPQDMVYLTKEQRLDQHIESVGLTVDSKGKIVNLNMRESVKD